MSKTRKETSSKEELQIVAAEGESEEAIEPIQDDVETAKESDHLLPKKTVALDRLRHTVRKVMVSRALERAGEEHRKRLSVPKPDNTIFGTSYKHVTASADGEVAMIEWTTDTCTHTKIKASEIPPSTPTRSRWILRQGRDPAIIHTLNKHFDLGLASSSLAADQTKESFARCFDNHVHIVVHMMSIDAKGESENEQLNIIVGNNFMITLQESNKHHFAKLIERIAKNGGRIREKGLLYLLVQVLSVCVVACNPVISYYGDTVENLEISFTFGAKREFMLRVQAVKRELLLLRKAIRPLVEIVDLLPKLHSPMGEKFVKVKDERSSLKGNLQEVHKRLKTTIDLIETYRELCVSIQELSNMDQDHEMNRVLYVLTMVTTIFVPCSFLAGVYGMNFKCTQPQHRPSLSLSAFPYPPSSLLTTITITLTTPPPPPPPDFPELDYKWAYPVWWAAVITIMFSLAMLFRYKRWS